MSQVSIKSHNIPEKNKKDERLETKINEYKDDYLDCDFSALAGTFTSWIYARVLAFLPSHTDSM